MHRLRPILLILGTTVFTAFLAGCGSSGSDAQPAPTGSPAATVASAAPPSSGAGASTTAGSTSASPSAATTSAAAATRAKGKQPLPGAGGYASGVGSGPASSRCALTAAQVGAVVGEPVKATSLESSGGGLACYFRATSSTSSRDLTVTVQKVAVPGLYAQSRKLNAGGTTTTSQDAGAGLQSCTVNDRTFQGRPAFTTRCSTTPDRQRLGSIQWDYRGGRFFFVGVQTVARTDRTPAQLLALSQTLATKLAG